MDIQYPLTSRKRYVVVGKGEVVGGRGRRG